MKLWVAEKVISAVQLLSAQNVVTRLWDWEEWRLEL